jgi:protein TonB
VRKCELGTDLEKPTPIIFRIVSAATKHVADDSDEPAFGTANPLAASLTPARERLTTTVFLAALFHGILILGVTFSAPSSPFHGTPSLEVMLLPDERPNDELNPEAAYLAQRNQKGSGTTTDAVRPTSPMASLLPTYMAGVADGNGLEWQEEITGVRSIDVVASHSRKSPLMDHGEQNPSRKSETPLSLFYALPAPVIATSADRSLTLRGKVTHEVEVAPNTREARVAPYLDGWKRKVERLGTIKYPMAARHRELSGNPVLEVVIRADGALAQIVVRRSSGYKELDQAAIGILRLASPFDPFPPGMQQDYDQLRFAYEWQFIGERLTGSVKVEN